jgi:hypothetical protein
MLGGLFASALALVGSACPTARAARPKNAVWPVRFRNERRSTARARLSLTIRVVFSSMSVPPTYAACGLQACTPGPGYERQRRNPFSSTPRARFQISRPPPAPYAG